MDKFNGLLPLYLGKGERGQNRHDELMAWAAEKNCYYSDGPSHSRLIQTLLDERIKARENESEASDE